MVLRLDLSLRNYDDFGDTLINLSPNDSWNGTCDLIVTE